MHPSVTEESSGEEILYHHIHVSKPPVSFSEKLLHLKQELAIAAKPVNCVLRCGGLYLPQAEVSLVTQPKKVKKPRPAEQRYAYSLVRACMNS
jgi:hypothetical protein